MASCRRYLIAHINFACENIRGSLLFLFGNLALLDSEFLFQTNFDWLTCKASQTFSRTSFTSIAELCTDRANRSNSAHHVIKASAFSRHSVTSTKSSNSRSLGEIAC